METVQQAVALFDGEVRSLTPALGRRHEHSSAKARRLLGWEARHGADTVVACADSLRTHNVV